MFVSAKSNAVFPIGLRIEGIAPLSNRSFIISVEVENSAAYIKGVLPSWNRFKGIPLSMKISNFAFCETIELVRVEIASINELKNSLSPTL